MKTIHRTLVLLLGITGSALVSTSVMAADDTVTTNKDKKIVCFKAPCNPHDIKPPVIKPPRPDHPFCEPQSDGRKICKKPGFEPPKPPVIKPPRPDRPFCKQQTDGREICEKPGITPPKPPVIKPGKPCPLIYPSKCGIETPEPAAK